jgi:hypothetical protein
MFKIFFRPMQKARSKNVFSRFTRHFPYLFGFILTASLCGCLSLRPLPKADISQPGWTIQQGQAVWKPPGRTTPEIAGELLLATNTDGSAFVQFTKTPFPFVIAQSTSNRWQLEIPPRNKRYTEPGKPSGRIVWFQLVNALAGKPLAKGWTWNDSGTNWQLTNSSGESLEGFLSQ